MPKKTLPPYTSDFETAWRSYPSRKAKRPAFVAYKHAITRLMVAAVFDDTTGPWPDLHQFLLAAIERYAASRRVQDCLATGKTGGIAYMATWCNNDRWEDEPDPGSKVSEPVGETMTRKQAKAILTKLATVWPSDVNDELAEQFIRYATGQQHGEFYIQGSLGISGKLYFRWPKELYVGCCQEDYTPARVRSMGCVNAELDLLVKGWTK